MGMKPKKEYSFLVNCADLEIATSERRRTLPGPVEIKPAREKISLDAHIVRRKRDATMRVTVEVLK